MIAKIVHATPRRLRLRTAMGAPADAIRTSLLDLDGVQSVRIASAARSLIVSFDGRAATKLAIVDMLAQSPVRGENTSHQPADERAMLRAHPREAARGEPLPVEVLVLAAALTPLLPAPARPPVAVALIAGKAYASWRGGADMPATVLDSIALASTALTGHPLTATTSLLLASVAERRRNAMLANMDELLADLAPVPNGRYIAHRAGVKSEVSAADLQAGDRVSLTQGAFVPADGVVVNGGAEIRDAVAEYSTIAAQPEAKVKRGDRLASGARVERGKIELRVERPAARSRAARMYDHVRHALRTRDAPGPLTPDLERLLTVPVTAAGLVLGLTGDAGRTGSMLQADPQHGIALAHPVAREAALYALARHCALMSGLESIDRLATATTFALEDVGVLAEPYWRVERVLLHDDAIREVQVRDWLARLAGHEDSEMLASGLPDEQVAAWREHGGVLPEPGRLLHIGGAMLLARTWGISLMEPDRSSLVRRLGVVDNGRLLATIHLASAVKNNVRAQLTALRASGVRRIAVFTEDPAAKPAQVLTELGADAIVSSDRAAQERWLDEAVERGERVALVHTGLRDLLPPGGLSLCPVDSEAGAHGVLMGDVLPALLAARRASMQIRHLLRRHFGYSVTSNSALMVAAAMQWLSPVAVAMIRHGLNFLLLQESAGLASAADRLEPRSCELTRERKRHRKVEAT